MLTPRDASQAPTSSINLYEAASEVTYGRRKSVVVLLIVVLWPPTGTGPRLKNIARRAVFVIDKSGTVRYREVLDDARNEPDYSKLNQALSQIGK